MTRVYLRPALEEQISECNSSLSSYLRFPKGMGVKHFAFFGKTFVFSGKPLFSHPCFSAEKPINSMYYFRPHTCFSKHSCSRVNPKKARLPLEIVSWHHLAGRGHLCSTDSV